jgi:polar amino acid transport system substrate-binding protein
MAKKWTKVLIAVAVVVFAVAVASGCKKEATPEPAAESATETAAPDIKQDTLTPGKLTIATGEPAFSPWIEDDDPANGEGFESAVAYAVADKLGFAKEDVVWVRTQFEAAITPGPKDFDINLQQFSATEERAQAVDFSSPYYVTSQAVVTNAKSKFADAKTLADLEGAKVGAASGSTSLEVAQEKFKDVAPFNDVDTTVQALDSNQIDAVVTDVPTAYYMIGAQLKDGKLVGEIEGTEGGDELSILLPKDSKLTAAVTQAVDELRADGTLSKLAEQWLVTNAEAVILK